MVTQKPNEFTVQSLQAEQESAGQADPEFLDMVSRSHASPREKYAAPVTTSQEMGWETKQLASLHSFHFSQFHFQFNMMGIVARKLSCQIPSPSSSQRNHKALRYSPIQALISISLIKDVLNAQLIYYPNQLKSEGPTSDKLVPDEQTLGSVGIEYARVLLGSSQ